MKRLKGLYRFYYLTIYTAEGIEGFWRFEGVKGFEVVEGFAGFGGFVGADGTDMAAIYIQGRFFYCSALKND